MGEKERERGKRKEREGEVEGGRRERKRKRGISACGFRSYTPGEVNPYVLLTPDSLSLVLIFFSILSKGSKLVDREEPWPFSSFTRPLERREESKANKD